MRLGVVEKRLALDLDLGFLRGGVPVDSRRVSGLELDKDNDEPDADG